MHFDCRLAGLGARFVLDRDGAGADGNSLRVYDEFFGSVIGYSGYGGDYSVIDADSDEDDGSSDDGNDTDDINNSNNDPNFFFRKYTRRSPTRTRERVVGAAKSFLARLFSSGKSDDKDKAPLDSTTTSTTTTTTTKEEEDDTYTNNNNEERRLSPPPPPSPPPPSSSSSSLETSILPTRSLEDILCWLPPTPQLLVDATILLLRMTIGGTLGEQKKNINVKNGRGGNDERWFALRSAWENTIRISSTTASSSSTSPSIRLPPMARIVASLVVDDIVNDDAETRKRRTATITDYNNNISSVGEKLSIGANLLGKAMRLARRQVSSNSDTNGTFDNDDSTNVDGGSNNRVVENEESEEWIRATTALAEAWDILHSRPYTYGDGGGENNDNKNNLPVSTGMFTSDFEGWEMDMRPLLEHGMVHAILKSCEGGYQKDDEKDNNDDSNECLNEKLDVKDKERRNMARIRCLHLARSICSEGVALRPNSPETWWRYGDVLEALGDKAAAENARAASISLGKDEGGRVSAF